MTATLDSSVTWRTPEGARPVRLGAPRSWQRPAAPIRSRVAFAAAHVVADPCADNAPGRPAALDWDATIAFRHHLWSWGLGVAEAMDTAQRGMGLDWTTCRELIRRSAAEAHSVGGRIVAGVGTDHLPAGSGSCTLAAVTAGYLEQLEFVEGTGADVVLMASRHLAQCAAGAQDYLTVYDQLLQQVSRPVVLHWLGTEFDPALCGYWGSSDLDAATETVLHLIDAHAARVAGIKISLLDAEREIAIRRRLPAGVRLFTGDDFHYDELIAGDELGSSDALLGAFAAVAPAASSALQALDRGDRAAYDAALGPTMALSRHLFAAPTQYYKTGIAFLAWLSGHQPGFTMVGGLQSGRSVAHLVDTARLAGEAGVLPDPELAARRLSGLLATAGLLA